MSNACDVAVPHYEKPGRGLRLREGMVITIEPMIKIEKYKDTIYDNRWVTCTADGSLSAQYEHTIAIIIKGRVF